jgi:hypothetical protein
VKSFELKTNKSTAPYMRQVCPMKRTLLLAWQCASQAYSETVQELAMNCEQISCDEYERLTRQAEHTRSVTADTHNAFQLHVEEHGC